LSKPGKRDTAGDGQPPAPAASRLSVLVAELLGPCSWALFNLIDGTRRVIATVQQGVAKLDGRADELSGVVRATLPSRVA